MRATTKTAIRTTPTITVSTTREDDLGAGATALGVAAGTTAFGDESTNTAVVAGLTAEAGVEVETAGMRTAAFLAAFFTGAFLATFFAGAFFAGAFVDRDGSCLYENRTLDKLNFRVIHAYFSEHLMQ